MSRSPVAALGDIPKLGARVLHADGRRI